MRPPRSNCAIAISVVVGLAAMACAGSTTADPLGEARDILCTTLDAYVCVEASGCAEVVAEEMNMPRFIQIDTRAGKLSTTAASGENRETIAETVFRSGGHLILQGIEAGRGFSLFVSESTGLATFAAAAEGRSVSAFGVCTPLPVK